MEGAKRQRVTFFRVSEQSKKIKRVTCPKCTKTYKNKASLANHMTFDHNGTPAVRAERHSRRKRDNTKSCIKRHFGSFIKSIELMPCVPYNPKTDDPVDAGEKVFMTRCKAELTKTIVIHIPYYSSWISVVEKSAVKLGFLQYLQLNWNNPFVKIFNYFGISIAPGPCSCHSNDEMNDTSLVAAKLDTKRWIAYAMDGPTYDEGITKENEIQAFRAKSFWRRVGQIRNKTGAEPNHCQWPTLNRNTHITHSTKSGQKEEDGKISYRIARSQQPIICPRLKCKIKHSPLNCPFFVFLHKTENDFARCLQ